MGFQQRFQTRQSLTEAGHTSSEAGGTNRRLRRPASTAGRLFGAADVRQHLAGLALSNRFAGTANVMWTRRAGAYGVLWLLVGFLGWAVFGAVVK